MPSSLCRAALGESLAVSAISGELAGTLLGVWGHGECGLLLLGVESDQAFGVRGASPALGVRGASPALGVRGASPAFGVRGARSEIPVKERVNARGVSGGVRAELLGDSAPELLGVRAPRGVVRPDLGVFGFSVTTCSFAADSNE